MSDRKRYPIRSLSELIRIEVGQTMHGGTVDVVNRADMWFEVVPDEEESTCLDCGAPNPHHCQAGEEAE